MRRAVLARELPYVREQLSELDHRYLTAKDIEAARGRGFVPWMVHHRVLSTLSDGRRATAGDIAACTNEDGAEVMHALRSLLKLGIVLESRRAWRADPWWGSDAIALQCPVCSARAGAFCEPHLVHAARAKLAAKQLKLFWLDERAKARAKQLKLFPRE